MKKKTKKLTGIFLLCLIQFGIQSCSNADENMDSFRNSSKNNQSSSSIPTVTTNAFTSVTSSTAVSGGTITSSGKSSTITSSGVCWSTTQDPTTGSNIVASSSPAATSFSCTITGLPSATVYYVRAYATNSAGLTGYGNQLTSTATASSPGNTAGYTASSPIVLSGKSNQTIQGLFIGNTSGKGISLTNCHDMIITGCKISHTGDNGIFLYNCYNITITHCEIDSVRSGLFAEDCAGGIVFNYNDVKNILGPMPLAQMVQFNNCNGAGSQVSYNTCDNISGKSSPEDLINMYISNGTSASPIMINGNKLRGGGPSTSGGGMLAGDNGGSFQVYQNNICVNTGNEGIEVAGGHDITVQNNTFYSSRTAISNVAISVNNQSSASCYNITIQNNQCNWLLYTTGEINTQWTAGNCGTITGWSTNVYNQALTASILPTVLFGTNK